MDKKRVGIVGAGQLGRMLALAGYPLGIPTAEFVAIDSERDLAQAADKLGWPLVLKTRRMGYDGRGQRVVSSVAELAAAWRELGAVPSIAEAWISFERELSLIAVQGANGQRSFYPLAA